MFSPMFGWKGFTFSVNSICWKWCLNVHFVTDDILLQLRYVKWIQSQKLWFLNANNFIPLRIVVVVITGRSESVYVRWLRNCSDFFFFFPRETVLLFFHSFWYTLGLCWVEYYQLFFDYRCQTPYIIQMFCVAILTTHC